MSKHFIITIGALMFCLAGLSNCGKGVTTDGNLAAGTNGNGTGTTTGTGGDGGTPPPSVGSSPSPIPTVLPSSSPSPWPSSSPTPWPSRSPIPLPSSSPGASPSPSPSQVGSCGPGEQLIRMRFYQNYAPRKVFDLNLGIPSSILAVSVNEQSVNYNYDEATQALTLLDAGPGHEGDSICLQACVHPPLPNPIPAAWGELDLE